MKKSINVVRFVATLALIAIMGQSFTTPSVSATGNDPVLVPQGTPVMLRLYENINSDNVEVGSTVLFEVANPVIVDGKEVVSQGTIAEGEVTSITRNDKCENCPSQYQSMEIKVNKVKAVDGKFIWLYGKPMTVKAKCPDCPVQVSQGRNLTSTVQSSVKIKA
jgi:Zn finger protein HypA/HybF involved in hydrogenase expression